VSINGSQEESDEKVETEEEVSELPRPEPSSYIFKIRYGRSRSRLRLFFSAPISRRR
jgi:hypothetical protein